MTEKAQIKSVALFFLYALLDEDLAKKGVELSIRRLKKKSKKMNLLSEQIPAAVVEACYYNWKKLSKHPSKGLVSLSDGPNWKIPEGADLGLWKEFQKKTDNNEFLAVTLSQVARFSEGDIARGLGVTEGTVRYRVGKGLQSMGELRI